MNWPMPDVFELLNEKSEFFAMKEELNWKSIIVGFIVLIIGILMIPFDIYWAKSPISLWVSIWCSLIAPGLVILLNGFLAERRKVSPLTEWGIKNIYHTQSRMNEDCDKSLCKAKHEVDVVAFGLSGNNILSPYKLSFSAQTLTFLPEYLQIRLFSFFGLRFVRLVWPVGQVGL